MLKEQEKHPPGPDRLHNVTDLPPTLEDQGITKIESHRWQQVATHQSPTPCGVRLLVQCGRILNCAHARVAGSGMQRLGPLHPQ